MKKRSVSCTVLMLLCLLLTSVNEQPLSAQAAGERRDIIGGGSDYTAILYDSSNGLPTSEANAIVQSSDGFIWLGGYSGLIRYDGSSFYRFDSSSGISSVFSLWVDSKDRLWIGTNENGLALYDHGQITAYGRVEELKSYSIRDICEDKDGNIIVATTQGMAYVDVNSLSLHAIDDPQINTEYITKLTMDGDGNIYGLTLNGAVFTVDKLRISAFYDADEFGDNTVNTIYADPSQSGLLYLGTVESELLSAQFNERMQLGSSRKAEPLKNISAILTVDDKLWVSATNGIGYYDEKGKFYELSDVPMNNSIGNILSDHEGNLWFTSTRQGVMKLVPDRFTDISQLAGLESMVVNSTCVNGGKLYLGTDSGLVILDLDTYAREENAISEELSGVRIRCIKNDREGNVWLCTHGEHGLVKYDPKTEESKFFSTEQGIVTSRVRAVMQRADGSMAAATSNGIFIVRGDEVVEHYGQDNGINTEEILSVEEGTDGKLYLGSDGDGIYVIDGNKVSRLGFEDGLTSGVVMRVKYDAARDLFWLITSNSIEYMKDGVATAVSNFPYSNNYDIIFDDEDGAWVLSSSGIYITKTSQLIANEDIEYSFYNTKSGLPYISTGNSRSCVGDDGYLYISGTTGVCRVDINANEGESDAVLLSIPDVEVDDKVVSTYGAGMISMPAGSRRLVVNAYVLTYGLSNPRISYWLEGFDKEPIVSTKQDLGPVSYTNLDGGRYTFHLNVLNDKTGEVERSILLYINKESSVYESILFWIVLTVGSILIVGFLIWRHFKKRNDELLKKQEEDREYINEIVHTFAKCVDLRDTQNQGHSFRVAIYARMLAEKLADKRGYSRDQIDEIYRIAMMHDIGKINIPDAILNKTQGLNDEEYEVMKTHAAVGEELLENVGIVPNLAIGAGYHHERLDGRGYPRGLKGDEIPEIARLIAVADTFDAMYSTRPYRKQMLLSDVVAELKRVKDTQLEGEVVDALAELADEGKLNKEEVDATIEKIKKKKVKEEPKEDKAASEDAAKKKNDEFMKSLGFGDKEDE